MSIKVAINGFGRIGRAIFSAWLQQYEENQDNDDTTTLDIVAINDLGDVALCAHLLQYDSTRGKLNFQIDLYSDESGNGIVINHDKKIPVLSISDPRQCPWQAFSIDIVLECTGRMTEAELAEAHIIGGAKRVLVSAPTKNADATIVYGINHNQLNDNHRIVSNASCTTNCLAPVLKVLDMHYGIYKASMTTIHAYTNDQQLLDVATGDPYRSRAAAVNMIPTKTGAASAIGLVIPELNNKIHGMAVRVPTANVSLIDVVAQLENPPSQASDVNELFETAAQHSDILAYNSLPLVSSDFNGQSVSSIVDGNHTDLNGNLLHLMAWYDNEWGFCHRMLDTARVMGSFA